MLGAMLSAAAGWHNPGVSNQLNDGSELLSAQQLTAHARRAVMWPTPAKLSAYSSWRRGDGVLINFHPRKTGGSTVCGLATENGAFPPEAAPEWSWLFPGLAGASASQRERMGHFDLPLISGCNCQVQLCWRQLLARHHAATSQRALCERGAALLEAHGMDKGAAHRIACSLNMLRGWLTLPAADWAEWARVTRNRYMNWEVVGINWILYPRHHAAMDAGAAPMVLTLRQPIERIYSEFRMYADWKRKCFKSHGLTFGAWVEGLVAKTLSQQKERWCNMSWVHDDTLRMGPLGADNLLTRALAARLNSSWLHPPAALQTLRRFSLVLDIPALPHLSNVALAAFTGWRGISINASARNRRPASSVYERHPKEALLLERLNVHDMALYAEAHKSLVEHATRLLAPAPPPAPPAPPPPPASAAASEPPPRRALRAAAATAQHATIDALCKSMADDARRGAMRDSRDESPPKLCYEFSTESECLAHFVGPRGSRWDARPCVWRPWESVWPSDPELLASRGTENQCQVLPQGSCAGVEVYAVAAAVKARSARGGRAGRAAGNSRQINAWGSGKKKP